MLHFCLCRILNTFGDVLKSGERTRRIFGKSSVGQKPINPSIKAEDRALSVWLEFEVMEKFLILIQYPTSIAIGRIDHLVYVSSEIFVN